MPQSYACLYYHIVFSTKEREPLITANLQPKLYDYIRGIVRNHGGLLHAIGGISDHVHLLVTLSREVAIATAVRDIKANSSRIARETLASYESFGWQDGYAAFTVGYSEVPRVRAYIAAQEEHHRERTYQEELIDLLDTHQISYNPKYLWD